jgi:hypothetical protein
VHKNREITTIQDAAGAFSIPGALQMELIANADVREGGGNLARIRYLPG